MSQYPTQAIRMVSTADASQLTSQSLEPKSIDARVDDSSIRKEVKYSAVCSKKPRLSEGGSVEGLLSSGPSHTNSVPENNGEVSKSIPDVASAIEDLLEQTSKVKKNRFVFDVFSLPVRELAC